VIFHYLILADLVVRYVNILLSFILWWSHRLVTCLNMQKKSIVIYYIIEPDSSIYERHDIHERSRCVCIYAHPYMYKRARERSPTYWNYDDDDDQYSKDKNTIDVYIIYRITCAHLFLYSKIICNWFFFSFPEDDDIRLMYLYRRLKNILQVNACDHTRSILRLS
jgi:hypothetical protein